MVNLNYLDSNYNKRLRRMEVGTPLGNSSITKGTLRVGGTGTLVVDGAGGVVIDGRLTGDGSFSWTGPMNMKGTVEIAGATDITGPVDISGLLKIVGDALLTGDLIVGAGGEITIAGDLPLTLGVDSAGRPAVMFSGGKLSSASDRVALTSANGSASLGAAQTFATVAFGANSVVISSASTRITGPVIASSLTAPPAGVTTYPVVLDAAGKMYRAPSSSGAI